MGKTSKFYNVTDVDALKAFNSKAVSMEPVVNHLVVMGLLKLFDEVPGVERIAETEAEVLEPEQPKDDSMLADAPEYQEIPKFLGKSRKDEDAA